MVRKLSIGAAAIVLAAAFGTVSAEAQTNRRRPVRPTPTPVPVNTDPVVVSRADDFPTVVIEPAPTPQADSTTFQTDSNATIEELRERLLRLESDSRKRDPDERQKRIALNLDILSKSEQRADGLRKQLFDMIEKESVIRTRIDQIDIEMRPEAIDRTFATVGSLRPEELRAQRRRSLELEKQNQQTLLTEVQKNRASIEINLQRADALVEKLRLRIEKEIDDALGGDEPAPQTSDRP